MATGLTGIARSTPHISPGRRRWVYLAGADSLLVASLAIWAAVVILMIVV
jgi:hypothetical protein